MMKRKFLVILVILMGALVLSTILLIKINRNASEMKQIRDQIEQRSGRKIKISSQSNMYYQAIRKGDDMEFVHKVIISQTRVKTGVIMKKGVSYKFEEYTFDEDVASVYLYIEYDESEKVSYIALQ